MGKGDQKTRRGKLFSGSFGKRRPRKKMSGKPVLKTLESKPKPGKEVKKKTEVSHVEVEKEVVEVLAGETKEAEPKKTGPKKPAAKKVEEVKQETVKKEGE